jgi:hypothetical protein
MLFSSRSNYRNGTEECWRISYTKEVIQERRSNERAEKVT